MVDHSQAGRIYWRSINLEMEFPLLWMVHLIYWTTFTILHTIPDQIYYPKTWSSIKFQKLKVNADALESSLQACTQLYKTTLIECDIK